MRPDKLDFEVRLIDVKTLLVACKVFKLLKGEYCYSSLNIGGVLW